MHFYAPHDTNIYMRKSGVEIRDCKIEYIAIYMYRVARLIFRNANNTA